jgi:hypothetical protein
VYPITSSGLHKGLNNNAFKSLVEVAIVEHERFLGSYIKEA